MSNIRFATPADIPALIEMGRTAHAESIQAHFSFKPERLVQQLRACIDPPNPRYCLFVAEREGQLVGAIWGFVDQHYFSDARVATELMFYVRADYRGSPIAVRLITAYRRWAENRGVQEIMICMTTGHDIEKFDRFLKRAGFTHVGGNYRIQVSKA
jgi:GNAT superfamily N-acetyltransferase